MEKQVSYYGIRVTYKCIRKFWHTFTFQLRRTLNPRGDNGITQLVKIGNVIVDIYDNCQLKCNLFDLIEVITVLMWQVYII